MITPQFLLPIHDEIVVDLFAGGGGASTGIELAIGRAVDIAINHDPEAISLHQANHPQTQHFCSDVFEVDPVTVCAGRPVGLLWASPDCKHFSKAKGGKPVSKKIRSLAWIVVKWVKALKPTKAHPRVICLENVEEFQTWGPLDAAGKPCQKRKGKTFQRWVSTLRNLGYKVEWKEMRASDYGAPTIRKRLFLVARRDGLPIVWPQPTHGDPAKPATKAKRLKPWRTAAECIDWSIPCPSIFERAKPLKDATLRRIAKGIMRYVVNAAEPFIVNTRNGERQGQQPRTRSIHDPFWTVTAQGSQHALIAPHLTKYHGESSGSGGNAPFPTITSNSFIKRPGGNPPIALVQAFLAKHYGGVVGTDMRNPISTITSVDHHSLVTAHLEALYSQKGNESRAADLNEPAKTITATPRHAVVTSNLVKLRGTSNCAPTDEPLHTVSADGLHHAEVRAFLMKYYGTDQDPRLEEPMHTVPTKDRFGLVTVTIRGEPYYIADIGMRMLQPHELFKANGFPATYKHDKGADGKPLTKTAQVRMCGNSVVPVLAEVLVKYNYVQVSEIVRAA